MRGGLSAAGIAILAVVCCAGLPLVVAAGLSAAAFALIGGIAVGALVLVFGIVLVVLRLRSSRRAASVPFRSKEVSMEARDCCAPTAAAEGFVARDATGTGGSGPLVEILYFDGCPNHHPALALVERVSRDLGIDPEIRLVNVPDHESARGLRFLGSPTVRVGGVDVDPHTAERSDYALSCRLFRTEAGLAGQPDERWVRAALLPETGVGA